MMLWKEVLETTSCWWRRSTFHIPHSTFHLPHSTFHLPAFRPMILYFAISHSHSRIVDIKTKPHQPEDIISTKEKYFSLTDHSRFSSPRFCGWCQLFEGHPSLKRGTLADWGRRVALGIYYYFEGSASFHIEIQPWYDEVYVDWERGDMKWEDSFKEVRELITNRYDYIYFDWTHRQEDQKSTWSA